MEPWTAAVDGPHAAQACSCWQFLQFSLGRPYTQQHESLTTRHLGVGVCGWRARSLHLVVIVDDDDDYHTSSPPGSSRLSQTSHISCYVRYIEAGYAQLRKKQQL